MPKLAVLPLRVYRNGQSLKLITAHTQTGIVNFIQKKSPKLTVKLSTEISHIKKLSRRVIQKLFYPNSTLLILLDFITDVNLTYLS